MARPEIFCAIDTTDMGLALELSGQMVEAECGIKLGLQFFNTYGPSGLKQIQDRFQDLPIFLDLKYHDIPNTVAGAIRAVMAHVTPAYLTIHAAGGREMMQIARESCPAETKILAVTILTSLDQEAIEQVGYAQDMEKQVQQMALLAKVSGLDGVVCSSHEIESIRHVCGEDFILMVPGIRPEGVGAGDQKRVMTPVQAMEKGATHLVIGRPITQSADPQKTVQEILSSLKG